MLSVSIGGRLRRIGVRNVAASRRLAESPPTSSTGRRTKLCYMRSLPMADWNLPFTPNVDTLDNASVIELEGNPMVFVAPAMPDRYWSLGIADAWYANLLYLGTRATGNAGDVVDCPLGVPSASLRST